MATLAALAEQRRASWASWRRPKATLWSAVGEMQMATISWGRSKRRPVSGHRGFTDATVAARTREAVRRDSF